MPEHATTSTLISDLIGLGRQAADPVHDLVTAAEGNLSGPTGQGTILVTASGTRLGALDPGDLVEVDADGLIASLETTASDEAWLQAVLAARTDPAASRPSVETGLHAAIRALAGEVYILHAHPTAVLTVLCSGQGEAFSRTRLIPDHVVTLGRADLVLSYADPGRVLAREVLTGMRAHQEQWGELPVSVLVGNHGAFVTGSSPRQALERMLMLAKMCRIYAAGGRQGMPTAEIDRIAGREDEAYRRALLAR